MRGTCRRRGRCLKNKVLHDGQQGADLSTPLQNTSRSPHGPCAQPGSRRVEWETDEPSLIEFGEKGTHMVSERVHRSRATRNKAVLLLSLESGESLNSNLSFGASGRCTVQSHPPTKVHQAQPHSGQGTHKKRRKTSPTPTIFTAIVLVQHGGVGSGGDDGARKYAEGFLPEKATTKRLWTKDPAGPRSRCRQLCLDELQSKRTISVQSM